MAKRKFYVYIITNKWNTTFYIGVTGNLPDRIYQHKNGLVEGFSKKYRLNKLVYYEEYVEVYTAICREKQLKNWHRDWKINLIKKNNMDFKELAEDWFREISPRELMHAAEMPKQVRHDGKENGFWRKIKKPVCYGRWYALG